jgi:nucleotide-binding universal stress UspA family protein
MKGYERLEDDEDVNARKGTCLIERILVGADGAAGSRRALEWAASRAAELHAHVVAPYVMNPVADFMMSVPRLSE